MYRGPDRCWPWDLGTGVVCPGRHRSGSGLCIRRHLGPTRSSVTNRRNLEACVNVYVYIYIYIFIYLYININTNYIKYTKYMKYTKYTKYILWKFDI